MSEAHHFRLRFEVPGNYRAVFAGFTRELFEALAPAFPPVRVLRYDGNRVGDLVSLRLGVGPLGQTWTSRITEHEEGDEACYFTDEGIELPFPFATWRHRHIVERIDDMRSAIVEDVRLTAKPGLLTPVAAAVMRAQLSARGPAYRRYFSERSGDGQNAATA